MIDAFVYGSGVPARAGCADGTDRTTTTSTTRPRRPSGRRTASAAGAAVMARRLWMHSKRSRRSRRSCRGARRGPPRRHGISGAAEWKMMEPPPDPIRADADLTKSTGTPTLGGSCARRRRAPAGRFLSRRLPGRRLPRTGSSHPSASLPARILRAAAERRRRLELVWLVRLLRLVRLQRLWHRRPAAFLTSQGRLPRPAAR